MRLLIDMNLAPEWVTVLAGYGFVAIHWSSVSDPRAQDIEIMRWARENHCVLITHDLDFGTILAFTQAAGPSVIQIRAHDVTPQHLTQKLIDVLRSNEDNLAAGCLIVLDDARLRVRILPLTR